MCWSFGFYSARESLNSFRSDFYYAALRYLFKEFDGCAVCRMSFGRRAGSKNCTLCFFPSSPVSVTEFISVSKVGIYRWNKPGFTWRFVWGPHVGYVGCEIDFRLVGLVGCILVGKNHKCGPLICLWNKIYSSQATSRRFVFTWVAELVFGMIRPSECSLQWYSLSI